MKTQPCSRSQLRAFTHRARQITTRAFPEFFTSFRQIMHAQREANMAMAGSGNAELAIQWRGVLMFKLIPVGLLGAFVCAGQITYDFVSLTGNDIYTAATGRALNQNGVAIGYVDTDDKSVVFDPRLGTIHLTFAALLRGINASGDVIGTTGDGHPFLSHPPYTTYIDLSNVFGPQTITSVDAINDRGDMVGIPLSNDQWFPGLTIGSVQAINNAGQVLTLSPTYPYAYLYTPGKGYIPLPDYLPLAMNNNGDLLYPKPPNSARGYVLTASGMIPLPEGYNWTAFNDLDEVVGSPERHGTYPTPVYYSVSTGIVDLRYSFQKTQSVVLGAPVAINNLGEILVNFTWYPCYCPPFSANPCSCPPSAQGVGLLIPRGLVNSDPAPAAAPVARAGNYTVNEVRVAVDPQRAERCCSMLPIPGRFKFFDPVSIPTGPRDQGIGEFHPEARAWSRLEVRASVFSGHQRPVSVRRSLGSLLKCSPKFRFEPTFRS
jgi:hypothetical protein